MNRIKNSFSSPMIDIANDYKDYITAHEQAREGVCYGASLYWASQTLSDLISNTTTKTLQIRDRESFFNFSLYIQMVCRTYSRPDSLYSALWYPHPLHRIIRNIHLQQKIINGKNLPELKYSIVNTADAIKNINQMCLYSHQHRNKAIIIGTATRDNQCRHATVLINIDGTLFFFDVNKGVYFLGKECRGIVKELLETVRQNLSLPPEAPCFIQNRGDYHTIISADPNLKTNFFRPGSTPYSPPAPTQMGWYNYFTQMPSRWLPGPVFRSGVLNGWSKN